MYDQSVMTLKRLETFLVNQRESTTKINIIYSINYTLIHYIYRKESVSKKFVFLQLSSSQATESNMDVSCLSFDILSFPSRFVAARY